MSSASVIRVWAMDMEGGILYFTDRGLIRKLAGGQISTLAGMHGPSAKGPMDGPADKVALGWSMSSVGLHSGALFVTDANRIQRLHNGMVSTINNPAIGMKDGPLSQARFNKIWSFTMDSKGNMYVADQENCRIRYIEFR